MTNQSKVEIKKIKFSIKNNKEAIAKLSIKSQK